MSNNKTIPYDEDRFTRFHIFGVKVEVDTIPATKGELIIDCSLSSFNKDRMLLRFPLISVWVANSLPRVDTVCKAHAALPNRKEILKRLKPPDKPTHEQTLIWELMAWLRKRRGTPFHHRPVMRLSTDDRYTMLRYGYEEPNVPYPASLPEEAYSNVPIFDNKTLALQQIFEVIKRYSKTLVSGLDLVNLNKVKDSTMKEIGFIEIPDRMGHGVSMWQGDPEKVATLGQSSYSRRSSSYYSSSRGGGYEEASLATQEIINSLFDVLEAELT